jgi:hypothetical protein
VAAGHNASGTQEVFAVGPSGVIYHDWQLSNNGATGWSGFSPLDRATGFTSVAAGHNASGTQEVFAVGPSGVIYHDWQLSNNGATGWSGFSPLGST